MEDLLFTKLLPPQLPGALVARPDLAARLDEGLDKGITLVIAPTGFGKTTLVSQWLKGWSQPEPPGKAAEEYTQVIPAWITLEDSDNDPIRFWRYVICAVQLSRPGIGRKALAMLRTTQMPAMESLLTSLLNDLAQVGQNVFLVLDDFHRITAEEVLETVQFLLAHRPPNLRLILLARTEPGLPLALLRARGEIYTLSAEDLRFSEKEATAFLHLVLPAANVSHLVKRLLEKTEGWPAGIRLVTLAAAQARRDRHSDPEGEGNVERFIETFHGEHRYVLEYLRREVFQKLPEPDQHFLLRTSLLDRLSSPLCNAILEASAETGGSAEILARLEKDGLFLTALESNDSCGSYRCMWYRYQPLFAEAMRHEAQQVLEKAEIRSIYRKASQWYHQHGLLEEAVDAALAAEESELALGLIEQFIEQRSFQEILILRRWCEQIPLEAIRQRPLVAFNYAQALLFSLDRYAPSTEARVTPLLQSAEDIWRAQGNEAGVGQVLALRGVVAWWQGELRVSFQLTHLSLDWLADTDMLWRGVTLLVLGNEAFLDGSLPQARQYLLETQAVSGAANNNHSVLAARGLLGDTAYREGQLEEASLNYQQVLAQAMGGEEMLDDQSIAWLGLARVAYEQNDLHAAEEQARRALELGLRRDNETIWAPAQVLLAWVAHHQGETTRALADLAASLSHLRQELAIREVCAALTRLALSTGDLAAALAWHSRMTALPGMLFTSQQAQTTLLAARLQIAGDRSEQALPELKQCQTVARSQGRLRDEIESLTLRAQAYDALGDRPQALQALTVALALGQPRGLRRIFLDEGRPLERLLAEITIDPSARPIHLYATALLHTFPPAHTSTADSPALSGRQPEGAPAHAMLVEPLSAQELRVLRLMAAGRSNPEIAETLVVSVNTVKTQVQSIYRKLNVRSRQEASEAARAFRLI